MNRRQGLHLLAAGGAGLLWSRRARAHGGPGPVEPPLDAPDLPLVDQHGRAQRLRPWMSGQVTLVQTIFTGCSSVCPVQGALFAALQQRLAARPPRQPVRLLSISIDALGDTPAALQAWLVRMQARPGWDAALPQPQGVDALRRALDAGPGVNAADLDAHSDKVYLFDAQARLRWRSTPLPPAADLLRAALHFAA